MTTKPTTAEQAERFPDPPPREPILPAIDDGVDRFPEYPPRNDMQNPKYLYRPSHMTALAVHLGSPETTLVMAEVPLGWRPRQRQGIRIPDLLVAFNVDCEAILDNRWGYAIEVEGKAPDFVLEVASRHTGVYDYTGKRRDYERFGVLEYWRYDPSGGRYHDAALAADRFVDGAFRPIAIEWLDERRCRGYSQSLQLYVCWEDGQLRWYVPDTDSYLLTHEEDMAGRLAETARADAEAARADAESAARQSAEAARDAAEEELARLRRLLGQTDPSQ